MEKIIKIAFVVFFICLALWYLLFAKDNDDLNNKALQQVSPTAEVQIIAFGDSLTAGYDLPINESYPAQLEVALKKEGLNVSVINAGVSGETTRGNLERATFIRKQNPDIVLLGIGGNDALRLLPIEDTKKNISETITILKSGEKPPLVFLLQMQSPLNAGFSYKRTFDAMYKDIASDYDLVLLPFLTTEVFLKQENKTSDGIHLNKEGYAKVIELYLLEPVAEAVEEKIKSRL